MTLAELRNSVMFQTNNDAEDLGEFLPSLDDYLNEGYDRLMEAYMDVHLEDEDSEYSFMMNNDDEPELPLWAHRAIADYGTYMVYRNGNVTKQNRSVPYYQAFMEMLLKLREAGRKKRNKNGLHFKNLYVDNE